MTEWVKVEGLSYECHKLRIGRVIAIATGECPAFEPGYSIEHDDAPYALEQESIDAARSAAEQALREMHDALAAHFAPSAAAALAAFGEAIATVARARLIERVTASDRVIAELGDGRAFELWPCGETLYVSGWGHDGMVELRKFHGDFEDVAAEAVAAFIEECER
jgi:hypothetical protein